MKLTVIVLAYNVEKYIAQALDSILMQKTNFQFDVLVGNDGSSDGTVDILKQYQQKFPDIIKLRLTSRQPRKYAGDYLNFANLYKDLKSEYFCVLDGDDFWTDEYKLQKQIDFLDRNRDFTICGHDYYFLYPDGTKKNSYDKTKESSYSFVCNNFDEIILGGHCPYMQTSSLIYRNVYADDEKMKKKFFHHMYKGDFTRTLIHAQKGRAKFINEIMSTYRILDDGDWNRFRFKEVEQEIYHIEFFRFHKKHTFGKEYESVMERKIKWHCRYIFSHLCNGKLLPKIRYIKYYLILKYLSIKVILKKVFSKKKRIIPDTRYLNESYAQHSEDNILIHLLNYKLSGFFVDVGAHHPYRYSNTYKLYKGSGWRGINIDPMPKIKEVFDCCRPRDVNLELGVGNKEGVLKYYIFDETALNTFDLDTAKDFEKKYNIKVKETKDIKVTTLENCLDDFVPKGVEIDFMNIDCEGMDYEVLCSNNWQKYKPKIVICETGEGSVDEAVKSKSCKFLEDLGYEFVAKTVLSSFFVLKK